MLHTFPGTEEGSNTIGQFRSGLIEHLENWMVLIIPQNLAESIVKLISPQLTMLFAALNGRPLESDPREALEIALNRRHTVGRAKSYRADGKDTGEYRLCQECGKVFFAELDDEDIPNYQCPHCDVPTESKFLYFQSESPSE